MPICVQVSFGKFKLLVLTYGECIQPYYKDSSGKVIALEPLFPSGMVVKRNDLGAIDFHYTENGKTTTYSEDQILHFKGFTLDGLVGLSAIQFLLKRLECSLMQTTKLRTGLRMA
ncbi:hypothetical protein BANRA_02504 [Acinetobacter baumannii]|nr:hypothetical protein BANRA_02504 [Acinetobacter baumannii]